ncbi:MAG: TetR/AcrR family transcriptional regulator [Aggregatilineales bacterium]
MVEEFNESDARERVLNVAGRLFTEKGYKAVRLRDIADELGIKQASLYYHVSGKEQLFVEVTERGFHTHRKALESAAAEAGDDLKAQLSVMARWLLSQTPLDFGRMFSSDMPSISEEHAHYLMEIGYQSMLMPFENVFKAAQERGEIWLPHITLIAGSFLSIITSIGQIPEPTDYDLAVRRADEMIEVLLMGLVKR